MIIAVLENHKKLIVLPQYALPVIPPKYFDYLSKRFSFSLKQDEKNQIMTTNVWLRQVFTYRLLVLIRANTPIDINIVHIMLI
jgi:hypothetical protein